MVFRVPRHVQIVLVCSQKLFIFTVATILPNIVSGKLGFPASYAEKSKKKKLISVFFQKKSLKEIFFWHDMFTKLVKRVLINIIAEHS